MTENRRRLCRHAERVIKMLNLDAPARVLLVELEMLERDIVLIKEEEKDQEGVLKYEGKFTLS